MRKRERMVQYLPVVLLGLTVACSSTHVKVRKVENLRPDFVDTVGRNNKVLVVSLPTPSMKEDVFGDYLTAGEETGMGAFSAKNYFETVPNPGPDARTLAASKNYGALKQKYQVDTLFVISQPSPPPTVNCNLKSETRYQNGNCIQWDTKSTSTQSGVTTTRSCTKFEQVPYQVTTSEISFSGKVSGNLINLNNGRKISVTSQAKASTTSEGSLCQGDNSGLKHRWADVVRDHVRKLIDDVSPVATKLSVFMYYTAEGIADTPENKELLKTVKEGLDASKTLADKGQFEEAAKIWTDIDKASGGKAAAAAWNLAIFHWNGNNLHAAKTYADQSFAAGSPDWQAKIKQAKDIIDEQHKSLKIKK